MGGAAFFGCSVTFALVLSVLADATTATALAFDSVIESWCERASRCCSACDGCSRLRVVSDPELGDSAPAFSGDGTARELAFSSRASGVTSDDALDSDGELLLVAETAE